jgi:hypothetical protein
MGRRNKQLIALTALLPMVGGVLVVFVGWPLFAVRGSWAAETWALAYFALTLIVTLYWSDQVRRSDTLPRSEKYLWWAVLWLAGIVGLPAYFFFRAWPDARAASE